ncbi:MAG TPA: hypothetical protein VLV45_01065 [Gemmatimonadales bacterium]|nr:hypothetical protein [Gemmatimonadales bacterium]
MRRSAAFRLASILLALALLQRTQRVAPACLPTDAAAQEARGSAPSAPRGMPGMPGMPHGEHHGVPDGCCVRPCCAQATITLPPPAATLVETVAVVVAWARVAPVQPGTRAAHFIPFATAPPVSA